MLVNLAGESLERIFQTVGGMETKSALDVFARRGDWHTKFFAEKVHSLEAWEIDPSFACDLKNNFPKAKVICRDSIHHINTTELAGMTYDIIVIDNPLNCYGTSYCEHFDMIDNIYKFFKERTLLIFNFVKTPFGYEKSPDWKKRREAFYGRTDTHDLPLPFARKFYESKFMGCGFNTRNFSMSIREIRNGNPFFWHVAMELEQGRHLRFK